MACEPPKHARCLCAPAKMEPPVTTTVQREKNACKVTFSPNIMQQAMIATNGILGDFVIRYDLQRDTGIGDVQVRLFLLLLGSSFESSLLLRLIDRFKTATLSTILRPKTSRWCPRTSCL